MKKLLFVLLAFFCITSCTKEEDYLYQISIGVEKTSHGGNVQGEGYAIYKEYQQALLDFENAYENSWMWKSTGSSSKSSDVLASNKFKPYVLELKKIFDTYQARFDACSDENFMVSEKVSLYLSRMSGSYSELEKETFVIEYGD